MTGLDCPGVCGLFPLWVGHSVSLTKILGLIQESLAGTQWSVWCSEVRPSLRIYACHYWVPRDCRAPGLAFIGAHPGKPHQSLLTLTRFAAPLLLCLSAPVTQSNWFGRQRLHGSWSTRRIRPVMPPSSHEHSWVIQY